MPIKRLAKASFFMALEYVYNKVGSTGFRTNISSGDVTPFVSRYPDGSTWSTMGLYGSYKVNLNPKLNFSYRAPI